VLSEGLFLKSRVEAPVVVLLPWHLEKTYRLMQAMAALFELCEFHSGDGAVKCTKAFLQNTPKCCLL
jgi:hypothetical protein